MKHLPWCLEGKGCHQEHVQKTNPISLVILKPICFPIKTITTNPVTCFLSHIEHLAMGSNHHSFVSLSHFSLSPVLQLQKENFVKTLMTFTSNLTQYIKSYETTCAVGSQHYSWGQLMP